MNNLNYNSLEDIPQIQASAAFSTLSMPVFREDKDLLPVKLPGGLEYIPWGEDNCLPYNIIDLIEKDETLSTCQLFNSEICYGGGLRYVVPEDAAPEIKEDVETFCIDNSLPTYFLGVSIDLKHFSFAVSVIILNQDGSKIVRLLRKEACYCRFTPAQNNKPIKGVIYANWRNPVTGPQDVEYIELLDPASPWSDLKNRLDAGSKTRKFALLSRVPSADSTYYPIPHYGSLFKGNWYNIKRLIGLAKEAKLKNHAPIKYQIEISKKYWESIFIAEGITDRSKQQERIVREKRNIIDFLTGAENSGKAWFSTFYINPDGKEIRDVKITKIDSSKEGGDWETDIQEAINMICFTMRVHSNLVGSVPGKAQTNNSGSDKRELYTIAQALQKPYHDMLFKIQDLIIRLNGWKGVKAEVPFIQLTTLDEHKDLKTISTI